MKKRIKDTPISKNEFNDTFFNFYKQSISFYFGNNESENIYVEDEETENNLLKQFLENKRFVFLLGRKNVGKSKLIKKIFRISDNNLLCINDAKGIICLYLDLDTTIIEKNLDILFINYLKSICSKLEKNHESNVCFFSSEIQIKFYDYLSEKAPYLLEFTSSNELINKSNLDIKLLTLQKAEEAVPLDYVIYRLNFYLEKSSYKYNNVIFIVDNIEKVSAEYRNLILNRCMKLYNKTNHSSNISYYLNVLIAMRNSTYAEIKENIFDTINIRLYYKNIPTNIASYCERKKDYIKDLNNDNILEEFYDIIINMTNKFNGKYSRMIANLCNYDFELMKKSYKKIFSNMVWLIRNGQQSDFLNMSKTESIFNNISVLRSIACGNNAVYRSEKSIVVPNIFINDEFNDHSIISLLIISYIINNDRIIKEKKLIDIFNIIFENTTIPSAVKLVIQKLIEFKVLDIETEKNTNYISITPRGNELWTMLEADSVLLEMYREDYYFEDKNEDLDFRSSYSLMEAIGQYQIFLQLFEFIKILFIKEQALHKNAKDNGRLNDYYAVFGKKLQSKRLLEGVIRSISYSGHMSSYGISTGLETLEKIMKEIDTNL